MSLRLYLDITPVRERSLRQPEPEHEEQRSERRAVRAVADGPNNNIRRKGADNLSKAEKLLGNVIYPAFFSQEQDNTRAHDYAFYFKSPRHMQRKLDLSKPVRPRRRGRSKTEEPPSPKTDKGDKGYLFRWQRDAPTGDTPEPAHLGRSTNGLPPKKPAMTSWQKLTGNVPVEELSISIYLGKQAHSQLLTSRQLAVAIGKGKHKLPDTSENAQGVQTGMGIQSSSDRSQGPPTSVVRSVHRSRSSSFTKGSQAPTAQVWPPPLPRKVPGNPDAEEKEVKTPGHALSFRRGARSKTKGASVTSKSTKSSKSGWGRSKNQRRHSLVGPIAISQVKDSRIPYVILPPPQPKQPIKESKGKMFKTQQKLAQDRAARETMAMYCEDKLSELVQLVAESAEIDKRCMGIRAAIRSADEAIEEQKAKEIAFSQMESSASTAAEPAQRYLTSLITGRVWEVQRC